MIRFPTAGNPGIAMATNECITALEYEGGIVALDSGMFRPQMAACYLLETDDAVALVEVGNNASADRIIKVLEARGRQPEEISHIIVTHVHLHFDVRPRRGEVPESERAVAMKQRRNAARVGADSSDVGRR